MELKIVQPNKNTRQSIRPCPREKSKARLIQSKQRENQEKRKKSPVSNNKENRES